jgi:hypothetical protein
MNIKNTLCRAVIVLVCLNFLISGEAQLPIKVNNFPISEVRLTTGPFKHAEDMDICYLLGLGTLAIIIFQHCPICMLQPKILESRNGLTIC